MRLIKKFPTEHIQHQATMSGEMARCLSIEAPFIATYWHIFSAVIPTLLVGQEWMRLITRY